MKDKFIKLINDTEDIEGRFHSVNGVATIYDVQDFKNWIQELKLEIQDIVSRTDDDFAKNTLKILSRNFNGWNDANDFGNIKGSLIAMKNNINRYYENTADDCKKNEKEPKIFISHSSEDRDYVNHIAVLLKDMGIATGRVFCSSLPGYSIPVGTNIFDYLRKQFEEYNLSVIIVHSKNYYNSAVCLNEMGAAWVLRKNCTSFLLPGFNFEEMKGVVNNDTIGIKLDDNRDDVEDKLNQLYKMIIKEFSIDEMSASLWEQARGRFMHAIENIQI